MTSAPAATLTYVDRLLRTSAEELTEHCSETILRALIEHVNKGLESTSENSHPSGNCPSFAKSLRTPRSSKPPATKPSTTGTIPRGSRSAERGPNLPNEGGNKRGQPVDGRKYVKRVRGRPRKDTEHGSDRIEEFIEEIEEREEALKTWCACRIEDKLSALEGDLHGVCFSINEYLCYRRVKEKWPTKSIPTYCKRWYRTHYEQDIRFAERWYDAIEALYPGFWYVFALLDSFRKVKVKVSREHMAQILNRCPWLSELAKKKSTEFNNVLASCMPLWTGRPASSQVALPQTDMDYAYPNGPLQITPVPCLSIPQHLGGNIYNVGDVSSEGATDPLPTEYPDVNPTYRLYDTSPTGYPDVNDVLRGTTYKLYGPSSAEPYNVLPEWMSIILQNPSQ